MLKELTLRGILFISLLKGRSCTYLDVKMILNFNVHGYTEGLGKYHCIPVLPRYRKTLYHVSPRIMLQHKHISWYRTNCNNCKDKHVHTGFCPHWLAVVQSDQYLLNPISTLLNPTSTILTHITDVACNIL